MRIRILTIGSALVVTASGAEAAKPAPPFTRATDDKGQELLSHRLETAFQSFMTGCPGLGPPIKMKNGDKISAINHDIVERLSLADEKINLQLAVLRADKIDLAGVFAYIYEEGELAKPKWESSQFLSIPEADQGKLLHPYFPRVNYSSSCGAVIDAALRADAGVSFGPATLKAALQADYNKSTNRSLRVARGRFSSPIWEMWSSGQTNDPNRIKHVFYSGMLFWDWYRNRTPATYRILTYFNGTYIFQETSNSGEGSAGGSVGGRVAIPFVTAQSDAKSEMKYESVLLITDPNILIDVESNVKPYGSELMPSVQDIADRIELNTPVQIRYDEGQQINAGQSKNFFADIYAMPAAFCNNNSWDVRDSRTAGATSTQLKLSDPAKPGEDEVGPYCRFRIKYTPGEQAQSGDAALTPYLFSSSATNNVHLKLALRDVSFNQQAGPTLDLIRTGQVKIDPVAGSSPPQFNLSWQVDFELDDDEAGLDITRIDVSKVRLRCPDNTMTGGGVTFKAEFLGASSQASRSLRMTGTGVYQGALDPNAYENVACTMTGPIIYSPKEGSKIRKTVPEVTLMYPRPKAS